MNTFLGSLNLIFCIGNFAWCVVEPNVLNAVMGIICGIVAVWMFKSK